MSNYNQLQREQREQIQQAVLNEREKMQRQIDISRNSVVLNKIKQVKGQLMKKCLFCDQVGIPEDILKHMKNSHKDDFLNMGENIDKYSKCSICEKLFKKKNIEGHQLQCAIKEDKKKAAREMTNVRNLKRRIQYCQEISDEKQEEEHNNLLKEFVVGTEINSKHIIQSQENNYSQSELTISILNSELFKTKKKIKTNEEGEENELTFQTIKKVQLKQPVQSQNDSFTNVLTDLNLNDEDQEGDTTKKKQQTQ